MLEASSTGHAQLKHKTINAEVNLLTEWQRQRDTLLEQIARAAVALTLISLLAFGSMPFLWRTYAASSWNLVKSQAALDSFSSKLSKLDGDKAQAKPKLDRGAMHDSVVREGKQFLGHTMLIMNATLPGMAIETTSSDVIGGELTIHCKADAENNSVAQGFMDKAGLGPNVESTLLSTAQKNGKLGPEGVGFEYVKRVQVSQ